MGSAGETLAIELGKHHHWALYGDCSGCGKLFHACLAKSIDAALDKARAEALEEAAGRLENMRFAGVGAVLRMWAKEAKS